MKIKVNFKSPDVLDYALEDLSSEDAKEVRGILGKWIKYEECVTLEFDTEEMTARVMEVS